MLGDRNKGMNNIVNRFIATNTERSPNNKSWLAEMDYLRGFAILAVIMIHTTVNFAGIGYLDQLVL